MVLFFVIGNTAFHFCVYIVSHFERIVNAILNPI